MSAPRAEAMTNIRPSGRYPHYTVRRVNPSLSGIEHGVDWWRVPNAPKGLLSKLLHAVKRKWRGWLV